jgi:hypothetical protein
MALMTPVTSERDPVAVGRTETELWAECLDRLLEFRAANQARFFDVSFADMQHEPVSTMERLYRDMGDELTDETRERMSDWWVESSKDRRQDKRPDPAMYGLDPDGLRQRYSSYYKQFGAYLGT